MTLHLVSWILPYIILIPMMIGIVKSKSSKRRRYFLSCFIVAAIAFLQILLHFIIGFGEAFVQGVDTGRIVIWLFVDAFILLVSILFIKQGDNSRGPISEV